MRLIYKFTVALFLLPLVVQGQNNAKTFSGDSLSLSTIINEVMRNYPSVKKAELDIESANAKIGLAKSAYYPNVDVSSSYSHIGPNSSITFPGLGTFNMYPLDNYSAALNYNQLIYDFGKTGKSVSFEQQSKSLTQLSVEQLKQKLSLAVVGNYYSIVFLQEAIRIKDEELATLNEHLLFIEKKEATGSATQYEILTTKVRISNIENQKTDLLTSLQVQLCQLNTLLGQPQNTALTVKKELPVTPMATSGDSLITYAFDHRDELKMAHQKNTLAQIHYKMVDAQNNPAFNFFASGGWKNGYFPDLLTPKANYAVGVGFKIPIFDATRTKYNRQQVKLEILNNDQDTELARRDIVNEVVESKTNADASLKKVTESELQLTQAQQAYSLAETSFQAGAITNLDLLDSSTSLSESRLALLKTKIDYTVSLLKLKIALGDRIY
jgi:outer membrane protein TolC